MNQCPYCGKELPEELQFCPYCMKKLIDEQPISETKTKRVPRKWWIIVIGAAALITVFAIVIGVLSSPPKEPTTEDDEPTEQSVLLSDCLLSSEDYHQEIEKAHPEIASYTLVPNSENLYTDTGSGTDYTDMYMISENGAYIFTKKNGTSKYLVNYSPALTMVLVQVSVGMGTIEDATADAVALFKNYPGALTAEELYEKFQTEGKYVTEYAKPYTQYLDTINGIEYNILSNSEYVAVRLGYTPSYTYTYTPTEPTNKSTTTSSSSTATTTTTTAQSEATETEDTTKADPVVTMGGSTSRTKSTVVTSKNTTTTKSSTGTTKQRTTTTAADRCAGGHTWEEITKDVEHDEVGHYEEVVIRYDSATIYKCAVCYEIFESLSEYYTHFEDHINGSHSSIKTFRELYETSTTNIPVYGEEWVVDKEAYTEHVFVGYRCSVCGATEE